MTEGFSHRIEEGDGESVVRFFGELDLAEESSAAAALAGLDASGTAIVDVSELDFIDSSGIRLLVEAAHRARDAGGSFAVAGARGDVLRVLELIEARDLVPMFGSVEEARAAVA